MCISWINKKSALIHYHIHKNTPVVSIMQNIHPVCTPFLFLKYPLQYYHPFMPRPLNLSVSSRFYYQNHVLIYFLSNAWNSSQHQNLGTLIIFGKIYKLLSFSILLLIPHILFGTLFSYILSFCSSHHVTHQVPCSYKAKAKTTDLYIQTLC